ncbi:all3515 family Zur-repressed PEP-CTERM protein [Aquincola tertiaricarbonis]|uniref:all3515 family Zur-repressed PEP-CTERM protein n=1 Tax=Aquincola tertiaricarbonis TaxID=391953 RepID=UPI000B1168ED|nr:all3515 family Zur-repressed PEP-CTERM protein [Aquincola tertiaricarbonis]
MNTITRHSVWATGMAGLLAFSGSAAASGIRAAEGIGYYIGVDSLQTVASGTFAGLANPNAGRLTLLLDHGNHFHGIGAYSYTGTAAAPVVQPTSANNRLPEPSSRVDEATSSIALQAGSGAYAGRWVSQPLAAGAPAADYSYLGGASIQSLSGLGTAAGVLYNSSAGRWNAAFSDVVVGLKLESISSGLKVAIGNEMDAFAAGVGSVFTLGDSGSLNFLPTFHADANVAPGVYSAQFSLVNLGGNSAVQSGGSFAYDFSVAAPVPEPQTWALMLIGLAAAAGMARRRKVG